MREELKQDRSRLINRMREQLRRYYPQMLELGGDLGAAWFLEQTIGDMNPFGLK